MFLELFGAEQVSRLEKVLAQNQAIIITNPHVGNLHLVVDFLKTKNSGQLIAVEPQECKIKIDAIREIIKLTTTQHQRQRLFLINQADRMVTAAQNSLLKTLEEPNANNQFILLTNRSNKLLPTIKSRAVNFQLQSPSADSLKRSLTANLDLPPKILSQIQFLAGDDFGAWNKLANDQNYLKQQAEITSTAKKILTTDRFTRLIEIRKISKDRQLSIDLAEAVLKILYISLKSNRTQATLDQIQIWLDVVDKLEANISTGLVLTQAVL